MSIDDRELSAGSAPEPTVGALVHDVSQQIPELIRAELRLAQAEISQKGKRAGLGIGMFGAAGVIALFGIGALVAAAILALDLGMPAWLAAVIIAVLLLAIAGAVALAGKRQVARAAPPVPDRAIEGIKKDVETVKGERG
jgi:uncharacterized membrane protein YqjE